MVNYQIDRVGATSGPSRTPWGSRPGGSGSRRQEGPNSTYPKLVIEAKQISVEAVPYAAAHPRPPADLLTPDLPSGLDSRRAPDRL